MNNVRLGFQTEIDLNVAAIDPARPPLHPRDRLAPLHRLGARARHRAMQGGYRRLVSRAQRTPEGTARRVDRADQDGTRGLPEGESGQEGCPVRGQPDRARLQ